MLEFFDCNCSFGKPAVPGLVELETVDELKEEMDRLGIGRALAYHVSVRLGSPARGNQVTARALTGDDRICPVWGLLPPQTGELGSPEEFISNMKANGVKALTAFPEDHRYLLNKYTFGSLFELLIEKNVPLLLKSDWKLITDILTDFPCLTVIALEHGCWGDDRFFRPLIEAFQNLYLDVSRYELDGGIEEFCRCYGPERLVFGTALPANAAGGPLFRLMHARIDAGAKEQIAAGNLKALLGRVAL